ncbi:MAG: glycosyltransferase family 1 protein [Alphaproteobacteria bacterium]|nr:glycosyltransferase family 1 protein [Alphaproteobacteria bacterium]
MSAENRIQTVVLTVQYDTRSSYYLDWAEAFAQSPLFDVTTFNLFKRDTRRAARRAIEDAELVVALHSCSADTLEFIKPLALALKLRRGRFLMLIGNEYNIPWARIGEKRNFLRDTAADYVGTQLPLETGQWLYADSGARVLGLPHALNEAVFRPDTPDPIRTIDIGGRSARYPVFIGDDERNRVLDVFARIAPVVGLRVDIDTNSRLDRAGWAAFLNDCRATLGTEAGSWYLERDDRTALAIREFLRGRSRSIRADGLLHSVSRHLPYHLKTRLRGLLEFLPLRHEALDHPDVSFAEIKGRFFTDRPRCPMYSKAISSRHFEAAGTGTCQILVRGRYNDILKADEHYIPLDTDMSDAYEAIERFADPAERRRIADSSYALVHDGHTYRHRIAALHAVLSDG